MSTVRLKSLYLEDYPVKKMYCNGDLVYQMIDKNVVPPTPPCNPIKLIDNLGNTNNQGFRKSGFYTFDSGITEINSCNYDFSGITCICSRTDAFYSKPNAMLGRSNAGMSSSADGCLRSVETVEIDCSTVTVLSYPFGNDSQSQFCQTVTSITLTNTDNVTTLRQLASYCTNLVNLNIGSFANVSTVGGAQFTSCPSLTNLTITALPKRDITSWGFNNLTNLTEQSVINILNALPSNASNIITIGTTNKNKLTSAAGIQALSTAQSKGWTVY